MEAENPRAVAGSNEAPDYARQVTEQMARDYAEVAETVAALLTEARALPEKVDDDETMGLYARIIKRFRDLGGRLEAFRIREKEPFLRGGNAVDGFFNALATKIARAKKTDKPGAADVLQARLDDYNQRKLAAERERRRREAEEAELVAREAREKAAREAREAEEARLAAERARKPENIVMRQAAADAAESAASASGIEVTLAEGKAEEAQIATYAKPADIVRTRVDDALVTMGTEPYAEIEDRTLLDKEALWAFINEDALAKALRAWAKVHGHNKQMAGAAIGKRSKSVVR